MSTFDDWEIKARWEMGERGIGFHEATPLIEEARAHHAESGQDPWAALGPPAEFAADVAAAQPAEQARRDTRGKTPRDYLEDGLLALGVIGAQVAVVGAIFAGGLTIPVTVAGLTGVLLAAAAALVGSAAPGALRAAGHPRLAPWGFAVAAVLVMLAGYAFVELPKQRIGELPALGLLAASLAVCWLATRPSRPPNRTGRAAGASAPDTTGPWERGAAGPSARDAAGPLERGGAGSVGRGVGGDGPEDAEAWFARLRALLVGRFDVSPARAAELVAETRAHVAASGSRPSDEFPSLAGYARDLAEGEPLRPGPWWRGDTARLLVTAGMGIIVAAQTADAALHGRSWVALCGVLALVAIVFALRERLRARSHRAAPPR